MAPIGFGLLACSTIARRRFAPALVASPLATLAHCGSRDHAAAKAFASEFGCLKSGSYEDVLNDPDVDCVYVSTPVTLHEHWVLEAARHGKHIICEKPAAMSYRSAEKIVDCCREHGVRFLEGYMFRYHPQHAGVRQMIEEGRVGNVRLFTGQFTYPRPPEGDIRLDPDLGGGVFLDSAGYPVAAALMLIDDVPEFVSCTAGRDRHGKVDNGVAITITFASGIFAQTFAGCEMQYRSQYAVHGTGGRISCERAFAVQPSARVGVTLETDDGSSRKEFGPADHFRLMIEAFVRALADSETPFPDLDRDFLRQHAVMDAAFRSWRNCRFERVDPYPR